MLQASLIFFMFEVNEIIMDHECEFQCNRLTGDQISGTVASEQRCSTDLTLTTLYSVLLLTIFIRYPNSAASNLHSCFYETLSKVTYIKKQITAILSDLKRHPWKFWTKTYKRMTSVIFQHIFQHTCFHLPHINCTIAATNDHEVIQRTPLDCNNWKQVSWCQYNTFPLSKWQKCNWMITCNTAHTFLDTLLKMNKI